MRNRWLRCNWYLWQKRPTKTPSKNANVNKLCESNSDCPLQRFIHASCNWCMGLRWTVAMHEIINFSISAETQPHMWCMQLMWITLQQEKPKHFHHKSKRTRVAIILLFNWTLETLHFFNGDILGRFVKPPPSPIHSKLTFILFMNGRLHFVAQSLFG